MDKVIDIVFVTYNSEKWIGKCFESILRLDYDLHKINLYFVDNASSDSTISLLNKYKEKNEKKIGELKIITLDKNVGFGSANNIGAQSGKSSVICFLNIDTELFEDCLQKLQQEIEYSDDKIAVWEFRQFPYEHPKLYDPITLETSWCSGAAFAIRRSVFQKVGGFDKNIFMYAEDVDLSWRIRAEGYKLKYVPKVRITHYSYTSYNEIKPNQHVYGVINNLLLRYRFGSWKTVICGHLLFWNLMRRPSAFHGAKRNLLSNYVKHFVNIPHFRSNKKWRNCVELHPYFHHWDYSPIREGAFYENYDVAENTLVSIIVRTCGRPTVLRETLISLRNQTYKNLEIVIIEDGKSISEELVKEEFSDLNILYFATNQKVGRSKVGNIAIEKASGKYINFLDDDDVFFSDHIEVLVGSLKNSKLKAAYATAYETPIIVRSRDPYVYELKDYRGIHKQSFNKVILCHHNYIPIQCIMFEKSLFEQYGGLDETVDALEDWDLWVRYSLYTDFLFVHKTTSLYRIPYENNVNLSRQKELDNALIVMRNKHRQYAQKVSVYDLAMLYEENL